VTTVRSMAERSTRALRDDERQALERERDFLLGSIEDLEAEHAAGDLDDGDLESLRGEYTARAARVIRSLDAAEVIETNDESEGNRPLRRYATIAAVGLFAVGAGFAMANAAGSRTADEVGTGDIRRSSQQLILDASDLAAAGDYDEAVEIYGEAIELLPSDPEPWTYRGWLHFQQGDIDEAVADLDEARDLGPTFPDVWVFSSIVAMRGGDIDEAREALMTFDGLNAPPSMQQLVDQQRLRQNITSQLAERGDLDEAIGLYDSALAARPEDALLNAERGWLLALVADQAVRSGDTDSAETLTSSALEFLDRAVRLDPTLPDPYAYRAVVYAELLGDDERAKQDVKSYQETGQTRDDLDAILAQSGL
jgi:tetratricopeptide (TPR) repeat protein